jgi:hypothetical protein
VFVGNPWEPLKSTVQLCWKGKPTLENRTKKRKMVIKYSCFLRGNLKSGQICLPRNSFNLQTGDWEVAVNEVGMSFNVNVPEQLVGIHLNVLKSWQQDPERRQVFEPTPLAFTLIQGAPNGRTAKQKVFKELNTSYYSFNQADELVVTFKNLITNDIFKPDVEVFISIDLIKII